MASQQYDVWSVKTPDSNTTFLAGLAEYTTSDVFVISNTVLGINGTGWQVSFTAADADETGVNLTITGVAVGDMSGTPVSEVVTGGNGSVSPNTVYSNTYFAQVTALSIDANTAGNVSVGFGGTLALPRTRLKGLYYLAGSNTGSVNVVRHSDSRVVLSLATPGDNTKTSSLYMAAEGILTAKTNNDYSTVTLTNVTSATLICG